MFLDCERKAERTHVKHANSSSSGIGSPGDQTHNLIAMRWQCGAMWPLMIYHYHRTEDRLFTQGRLLANTSATTQELACHFRTHHVSISNNILAIITYTYMVGFFLSLATGKYIYI